MKRILMAAIMLMITTQSRAADPVLMEDQLGCKTAYTMEKFFEATMRDQATGLAVLESAVARGLCDVIDAGSIVRLVKSRPYSEVSEFIVTRKGKRVPETWYMMERMVLKSVRMQ